MKQQFQAWQFAAALLFCMVFWACAGTRNSAATSKEDIGPLLESKSFVFVPQTVTPTRGRTRQVTPDFFFRVSGDTVQSYLPYFGRSYAAPMNPSQGGMDFTTTNFGYQVNQGKKDATVVTIEPRSGTDVRQITMQIFPNGNASLVALSTNRETISYNGYIRSRTR